jgi:hypothetical protein
MIQVALFDENNPNSGGSRLDWLFRMAADCGMSGGGARRNGGVESRPSYVSSRSVTRARPASLPTTTTNHMAETRVSTSLTLLHLSF